MSPIIFLDRPWSQVSPRLPPSTYLHLFRAYVGFGISAARRFSKNILEAIYTLLLFVCGRMLHKSSEGRNGELVRPFEW